MLATAALDRGDRAAAQQHAARSLALRPSWPGYRLLALLSPDTDTASENYLRAWRMGDAPPELAVEIAMHFMAAERSRDLKTFVDGPAARHARQ